MLIDVVNHFLKKKTLNYLYQKIISLEDIRCKASISILTEI